MHPLFPSTATLTDQEIEEKIGTLHHILRQTQNPSIVHQVQLMLTNLMDERQVRYAKILEDAAKGSNLDDLIDIG